MKVGMNSQCLRIIGDNEVAFDYHITDGTTASKFMRYASGTKPQETDLDAYDSKIVSNEDEPMTWGTETDKMTDIYYADLKYGKAERMIDSQSRDKELYNSYYPPYTTGRRSPYGTSFHQPIQQPVVMSPPPPRRDFSKTYDNDKNFKNLFDR